MWFNYINRPAGDIIGPFSQDERENHPGYNEDQFDTEAEALESLSWWRKEFDRLQEEKWKKQDDEFERTWRPPLGGR